jgi:NitT/TauT family transport system substrate-binding protein
MTARKNRGSLHCVTVLALAIMGAFNSAAADEPKKVSLEWLGATASIDPLYAYVSVAKEMGYLTTPGMAIDLQVTPMNGVTLAPVVAGRAPIGFTTAESVLFPLADGQDPGIVFFFNLNREPIFPTVVLPDSPIKTIGDLKGKTIGTQALAGGPMPYVKGVMKSLGFDPDRDVEFVAVGSGPGALTELQRGNVQALVLAETQIASYENLGAKFRYLPQEAYTKVYVGGGLFTRRDYLASHKPELCTFGQAMAKGLEFLLANPEAAVRIHWKWYPETKPKGVDDAVALQQTLHILEARSPKYDPRTHGIDKYAVYVPQEWAAVVKALGLDAKIPADKVNQLYSNELVDCINDFDREKIREQARNFKL